MAAKSAKKRQGELLGEHDASDAIFEHHDIEVNDQGKGLVQSTQVVHSLSNKNLANPVGRLEFNWEAVANNKITPPFTRDDRFIRDVDRRLSSVRDTPQIEFVRYRFLIHSF